MSGVESPLRVIIAADTAMSRDVVRFFLQASQQIEVMGEAASAEDASWMADKYEADAVVLHAGIAFDETQDAVRQIRDAAPVARIVVVTPEGGGVPLPVASRGADSYLEEGVGLAELAFVLVSLCRSPDIAIDVAPTFSADPRPTRSVVVVPEPEPELVLAGAHTATGRSPASSGLSAEAILEPPPMNGTSARAHKGVIPLIAAASAFVLVVGLTMYRTHLERVLFPTGATSFSTVDAGPRARTLIRASQGDLHALAHSLDVGKVTNAPALARSLIEQRSQALAAGADVSALDHSIEATLRPIITASPPSIAVAVLAVLAPALSWASADLDHLLIEATPGQTPSPPPGTGNDAPAKGADPTDAPVSSTGLPSTGVAGGSRGSTTGGSETGSQTGGGETQGGGGADQGGGGGNGGGGNGGGGNGGGGNGGGGNGGGGGAGDGGGGAGDGDGGGGGAGDGDGGGDQGGGDDQGGGQQGGGGDQGGGQQGGGDDQGGGQQGGGDDQGGGDQGGGQQGGGDDQGGDQGGGQQGGGDDQGGDHQTGGDSQGDDQSGGEDQYCDHPGNGDGHGYGHCDGHGGGNADHEDGSDHDHGGGNGRPLWLLSMPLLPLTRVRRRR